MKLDRVQESTIAERLADADSGASLKVAALNQLATTLRLLLWNWSELRGAILESMPPEAQPAARRRSLLTVIRVVEERPDCAEADMFPTNGRELGDGPQTVTKGQPGNEAGIPGARLRDDGFHC